MKPALALLVLLLLLPFLAARAEENEDRVQYLRTIVIEANESVEDAVCVFCSIIVRGTVQGDEVVVGGGATVESLVAGDVVILGGGLQLKPDARVVGDAVVYGGSVDLGGHAHIEGEVQTQPYFHLPGQRQLFWRGLLALAGVNLGLALLGWLLLWRRAEKLAAALRQRPWWSLLAGIAALAMFVALYNLSEFAGSYEDAVDLAVTGLLVVAFLPGYAGLTVAVGRWMAESRPLPAALLMGVVRTTVLLAFPLLGFVNLVLLAAWALGATALARFGFKG